MVCTRSSLLVVAVSLIILNSVCADYGKAHDKTIKVNGKDMTKKSIVFDKSTPDVFYCIPNKPTGEDKIIVRAKPLHKLCEFEGNPLPDDYKSDCYQDVDESNYACKEKYRIMMRLYPPGSETPYNGSKLSKFNTVDEDIKKRMTKTKTKTHPKSDENLLET